MRRIHYSSHVLNGKCTALMASSCSDTRNGEGDVFRAFFVGVEIWKIKHGRGRVNR